MKPFSSIIKESSETYKPTSAMASAAKRAKEMRDSVPDSEKGMTSVGLKRMNQLIDREPLSYETVKRMYSFFSRHEVDKKSKEWKEGKSKGEQAWLGWGGDAGYSWSRSIVKRVEGDKVDEAMNLLESSDALEAKASESGISKVILKKVYSRGLAASQGKNPHAWAMGRVNAFIKDHPNVRFDKDLL